MFFSRNKNKEAHLVTGGLATGVHHTPGLELLCAELDKHPPKAILDLGSSTTENLRFFGRYCEQVTIQDIARTAGGPGRISENPREGRDTQPARTALFALPEEIELPADGTLYDVILLWDILHYVPRAACSQLLERLSALCRPGGLIWMIASASAPIPLSPMRFRIEAADKLFYQITQGRAPSPRLNVRMLEKWLPECEPVRLFQLRNGFQELLFKHRGAISKAA